MSASWKELTRRHGIAAAADHSRIVQFEHGSVMVETEHPAWIQLLQTKQQELLDDLQKTFPANNIASISFRLTKKPQL
ncbi:hypothetical protein FACS1894164_17620 [Spirochaetia bacterium]|nr:hypothetical protein FACS1894164_17620 [Spirochaetia bacterium]